MERFHQKYCCNLPTQHFENCWVHQLEQDSKDILVNRAMTQGLLGWIFTRKWHKKIILLRIFPLTGKTGYNNEKITLLSSQDFFVRSLLFYFRIISKGPFLLQLFLGYNNIYWILGFQSLSKILRLGKNT